MPAKYRGCSKCPVGKLKHDTSTHREQNEGTLLAKDEISEMRRSIRLSTRALADNVYCEMDVDDCIDSDDDLGQDFQQGNLCVSSDPRRVGGPGGEPTIINLKKLRTLFLTQQSLEDQTVWMTTTQVGFPVTADTQEVQTDRDRLLGKPVARFLHPVISTFIQVRWQELVSTDQAPSRAEALVKRLEETWGRVQSNAQTIQGSLYRRVLLRDPALGDDSGLGWVQIHRKSSLWEEKIEGFSIVTSEGLTTLAHPQLGWTITSGMWNILRTMWGPTMTTLTRIYESCRTQSLLERVDVFTTTRHILQAIRRTWKVDSVHGLPAVVTPSFFPSAFRNDDIWWGSQGMKTVYLWDSMDDQDNSLAYIKSNHQTSGD